MKYLLVCFFLLRFSLLATAQFTTSVQIDTSVTVGDRYEIYISVPATYLHTKKYKTVYYLDANLKSGKKLRNLLNRSVDTQLQHSLFIGIGHIGNYHDLRRRDFMLPPVNNDNVPVDEQAVTVRNFYTYLTSELLPKIQRKYTVYKDSSSIIGHSFGGLFVVYCLFQNDTVFNSYFALSPSLWAGNYAIYHFNKMTTSFPTKKYLYFCAGANEKLNRILKGTEQLKQFLEEHSYAGLKYDYEVIPGKAHNSEVPVTLQNILNNKFL